MVVNTASLTALMSFKNLGSLALATAKADREMIAHGDEFSAGLARFAVDIARSLLELVCQNGAIRRQSACFGEGCSFRRHEAWPRLIPNGGQSRSRMH